MIVRIRFGPGRSFTRRQGKNARAARLLASVLSLSSISLAILGFWRIGQDLGFTGDFVFASGLLSHWQVWIASAICTQYACWRLTRYSKRARYDIGEAEVVEEPEQPEERVKKATAGV